MKKIYENSRNYTATVVKLPNSVKVEGLDNLVRVTVFGNDCLIGKDTDFSELHLFFPSETKLSDTFISKNNLYRHSEKNENKDKKGFFEDNGRVKSIKFKGVISTGFIIPLSSLNIAFNEDFDLKQGDEFNEICDFKVCEKYIKRRESIKSNTNLKNNKLDIKFAPEHIDTSNLMRNHRQINDTDYITISIKLHGTSARYFNTLVPRKLSWKDKLAKFFKIKIQEDEYQYVCGSRRVIKSIGFDEEDNKVHYYEEDLWSKVGKIHFENKLNKGEAVYCEIIGKDYKGKHIQHGYTYNFDEPKVFIYRISNINPQGIEIDLTPFQMKLRAEQLGIDICPIIYEGTFADFLKQAPTSSDTEASLNYIFYDNMLEKPSIFDKNVVEEGFCVRVETSTKPKIFKIKSKKFLLNESVLCDKGINDIEEDNSSIGENLDIK